MKRKSNKVYVKWKGYDLTVEDFMTSGLTFGLIKKIFLYKMSYFPEP